jgi:hypothetical protein
MAIKFSEMEEKTTALDYEDLACVSEFDAVRETYTTKKIKGYLIRDGVFNGNVTGSFYDTQTQTTLANTPTPMRIRNNALANDCSIVDFTKITTNQTGVFNVQFSAQLYRTSGGTNAHIDIWFALNGVNIDNSNTRITIANNSHYLVASWNFVLAMSENDYIEIMWMPSVSTIQLQMEEEQVLHPATPSVIATFNRIG